MIPTGSWFLSIRYSGSKSPKDPCDGDIKDSYIRLQIPHHQPEWSAYNESYTDMFFTSQGFSTKNQALYYFYFLRLKKFTVYKLYIYLNSLIYDFT